MAELVGGNPLALIVGEEDFTFGSRAPTERVAEAISEFLRFLARNKTKGVAGADHASIGILSVGEDKCSVAVAHQAIGIVVGVRDAIRQRGDAVETRRWAAAG